MTPKQLSYGILRATGIIAFSCLTLYFLWLIRSVFAYLAIAFVLAMIGRPLMNLLDGKLKIPNFIGAIITIGTFILLFISFISLFISFFLNEPFSFFGYFAYLYQFDGSIINQFQFVFLIF